MRSGKYLLITTAVIEFVAGGALISCPPATVLLLLGAVLETSAEIMLARIIGVALVTLALTSWFAHYDEQSHAAKGFVGAMAFYNLSVVAIFGLAAIQLWPVGAAPWPAVAVHAAMCIWCLADLREKSMRSAE